jgi:hypothetical protein
MRKPRGSRARVAALVATLAASLSGNVGAAADLRNFEQAFNAGGEPPWLHYQAEYLDSRGSHRLEVWRDHDARILRKTDDRIVVNATRLGDDIRFAVGDTLRGTVTTVDRVNLMRVGLFVDWFAQGHAIARPTGVYRLDSLGTSEQALGHHCSMWRLTTEGANSAADICWDDELKLPLSIRGGDGRVVWRITAFDMSPIADAIFAPTGHAEARTDMNADFGAEAD